MRPEEEATKVMVEGTSAWAADAVEHRVAVVYNYFPHYRAGIVQELAQQSHNRYVFYSDQKDSHNEGILMYGFPTDIPHVALRNSYIRGGWMWQHGVVKVALSKECDTMLFLGDAHFLSTWVAAWCARYVRRKRVLFWTIGWHRQKSGLTSWARCRFYSIAHALLLYGQYGWQMAVNKGFSPGKCYVIGNSLDWRMQVKLRHTPSMADVKATRLDLGVDPNLPMVICVSRLTPKRRLELLFEAASSLRSQGMPVSIVLVGEGRERDRLQRLASELALDVVFVGAVYDEARLASMVQAANATVCPGMAGLTAIQSLTYGTPVITHDDPEHQAPESEAVLTGVTGELFERDSVASLATAIEHACSRAVPDNALRVQCYREVDEKFNPMYQRYVIDGAVSGWLPSEAIRAAAEAMHTCPVGGAR